MRQQGAEPRLGRQEAVKNCQYWRLRDTNGKPPGLIGWWPTRAGRVYQQPRHSAPPPRCRALGPLQFLTQLCRMLLWKGPGCTSPLTCRFQLRSLHISAVECC